jgi:hypothetical protein
MAGENQFEPPTALKNKITGEILQIVSLYLLTTSQFLSFSSLIMIGDKVLIPDLKVKKDSSE